MEHILCIDAAARTASRTRQLAEHLLTKLDGAVTRLPLRDGALAPLDEARLRWREACCAQRTFDDAYFDAAKQFAAADTLVIAAPFWDGSFPAVLKKYLETVCVCGLTFRYTESGAPRGLCRARRLFYVTAAGGMIGGDVFGFGYVEALATGMFGIPETRLFKAEGLDILGADTARILAEAKARIDRSFD